MAEIKETKNQTLDKDQEFNNKNYDYSIILKLNSKG